MSPELVADRATYLPKKTKSPLLHLVPDLAQPGLRNIMESEGTTQSQTSELDDVQAEPVETLNPDDLFDEYYTPSFENGDPAFVDISTSAGTPTTNVNTPVINVVPERPKKKAKVDAKEASIHDAFGNFMAQSSTAFLKIADSVGYEDRLSAKKERVFAELEKLDLQLIDMFSAHAIIVSAEENVDTFYGIPENYRQAWVEAVLAGQIKLKTT
ncbi:hypothetical protein RHSIM_Rhsim02G0246800 [Rhododendron simsii]|uniref:Uncharacterized protein n=1 Tax=Rhododendron simsii TaxID=118357 RepID=A0A834HLP4_RHOSS|nr:hypothetical protein RHSIM_Rhsim02G0246800 [Rhododendron simsii]